VVVNLDTVELEKKRGRARFPPHEKRLKAPFVRLAVTGHHADEEGLYLYVSPFGLAKLATAHGH
jgi:hypothetical protein